MNGKTPVVLLTVGASLLVIGGAMGVISWMQSRAAPRTVELLSPQAAVKSIIANAAPPANTAAPAQVKSSPAPAVAATVHPAISQQDLDAITAEIKSANLEDHQKAIAQMRALAESDAKSLSQGIPAWIGPMLDDKLFSDVEQLSAQAIIARSSLPSLVEAAQRGRVMACIGEGNYQQALKEAKSYYNVAALSDTGDAVRLLTQVLTKTNGAAFAARFQSEQLFPAASAPPTTGLANTDSPPPAEVPKAGIVKTLPVDGSPFAQAITDLEKNGQGRHSYNHIAQGNLLLLADKPEEARKCFVAGCQIAKGDKNVRDAVEGVARAMRAADGNVVKANAYINSLREDPSKRGQELVPPKGSPTLDDIQAAAEKTTLGEIQTGIVPPIELERQKSEQDISSSKMPIDIANLYGADCYTPIDVHQLSATHFVVSMGFTAFCDWFMFRVNGAAGKTIRIDLTGQGVLMDKWLTLNPMYSYVNDVNDPRSYIPTGRSTGKTTIAWNGSILPSTEGQNWHYISDVWRERPDALSIVQQFSSDSAIVAMRVPYTPGYNEIYLKQMASNPLLNVIEVGRSVKGRPLLLAKIGGGDDAERTKPCILVYAREHADEQDSSWVAQGVIEQLLADTPEARNLRARLTVLVIPILDPDSAEVSRHVGLTGSFSSDNPNPESIAYASWFRAWVGAGKRLDLVYNLHNVQSAESPDVACALLEKNGNRGAASATLNSEFVRALELSGYSSTRRPWQFGWSPDRLGGWLSRSCGPLTLAYEVNSQSSDRHLSISELKRVGWILMHTTADFLNSESGQRALTEVDDLRGQRAAGWIANGQPFGASNDKWVNDNSGGASKMETQFP